MKSKRSFKTLSIRSALLMTVCVAAGCAYTRHLIVAGESNRKSEQSVLDANGRNLLRVSNSDIYEGPLLLPESIADLLPDVFLPALYGITEVDITLGSVDANDLADISQLPDVRVLRLGPVIRPPECLPIIRDMKQLDTLVITDDFGHDFDSSVVSFFETQLPSINVIDQTQYRRTMR
ncbi:hypothetical protein [Rhodopirellula europaea]|uniref:hypothetical protein n=1 Tax=Rhodopirellula europaea TaxID=1263866 RepID=UPI00118177D3|nr:hypothetical protein [Rhodopirellula europaea]